MPFVLVMNQSPARQKRVKMRWEQSTVPNDRSAWKDTSGTRIWLDLWSWDGRSSFLGKFINFEVPLLLHVWVESGRLLLGCCFRGQQRFSKAMSTSRLAWDGPFGTSQVRSLTFIMRALKTLPALPPDSKESLKMMWSHCRNQRATATRDSWASRLPDRNGWKCVEQSMVPNDRNTWKDTSGTRVLVDLWSSDRSSFFWSFIKFEVLLLLHVWVESGRLLLECCFRGQQRFSKAMSASLAWDVPLGTLQVRPQTFISMRALKTLPALPPDSLPCQVALPIDVASSTGGFSHLALDFMFQLTKPSLMAISN